MSSAAFCSCGLPPSPFCLVPLILHFSGPFPPEAHPFTFHKPNMKLKESKIIPLAPGRCLPELLLLTVLLYAFLLQWLLSCLCGCKLFRTHTSSYSVFHRDFCITVPETCFVPGHDCNEYNKQNNLASFFHLTELSFSLSLLPL